MTKSNEQKILEILIHMQEDISGLKDDVSGLKDDVSGLKEGQISLKEGQAKLEEGQAKLEAEVTRIRESLARIEYDHGKKIGVLFDGLDILKKKLDGLPESVAILIESVSNIENAVTDHTHDKSRHLPRSACIR